MKKILALPLSFLCVVVGMCFVGCGKIEHNAVIIADGATYRTEWLDSNYVYGAYIEGAGYDEDSPESRTYIIKNQEELDEIFSEFPQTDFEKEMVVVYCYRTIYVRKQVLEKVVFDGNVLKIEFNVVRGKIGHADAAAPHRRTLAVKLDKLDITEAKIQYKGQ